MVLHILFSRKDKQNLDSSNISIIFSLTGSEEVPPVETNATGKADISAYTVAKDSITYSVNARTSTVLLQVIYILVNQAKMDP